LTVPAKARDAIRPLASLFLDTAVRHIMSLRPDPQRRIWLEIDELPSLQSIPSLSPALAEGRKYGIGAILGVQSFHQLKKSFGDDLAQALWGLPKTRLYLRISDAETADMISRELGEIQLKRKTKSSSESSSVSTGGAGGGSSSESSSTSEQEQITQERIVLPAEIVGLPDLTGYLRTGGSHRVAKVKVNFDGLPRFGDQPDFIWKQQRPMPTAESIRAATTQQVTTQPQEQTMTQTTTDVTKETETEATAKTTADALDDAAIEAAIRARALELMQESMSAWADEDVAALSDDEMSELTKIFVERAEIEVTGGSHDVSAS
jgi:type IV secretory pathway TraG/TraD family ATPase VirD4